MIKVKQRDSFSNLSVTSPTPHSPTLPSLYLRSQLILQPFRCFTYITAHSPTLPLLHLCHGSFSNPSVALPTSEFILQPFHCFTYITAHSPTLPLLHLHHSSFFNPSVASPMTQLILQPIRRFSYVSVHSPTLPLLHLYHSFFQLFFRFSYVTGSSLTSPGEPPMVKAFINYVYKFQSPTIKSF